MKFKPGDWAQWSSQAAGSQTIKVGECIAVVPSGEDPARVLAKKGESPYDSSEDDNKYSYTALDFSGSKRDHESYLFALERPIGKRKLYWPRVKGLQPYKKYIKKEKIHDQR